uniref:Pyrrolo-quinoline quinone repeat domain-containing protein n=1 Tax=viral metagenome TaxID=1070528 RepID=A0A6C0K915_9ZZZZ
MSIISNVTAYSYTDKISALTVATTPYNNTGNYYNVMYIGTSNGKIYSLTDYAGAKPFRIIPSGNNIAGLSGEITGLAVDPTGKYLFVNAPYDRHCLRFSIASIPLTTLSQQTQTVPIDLDIYTFGDNTGNITVDSQGVVYLVTGNGSSISTIERYGNAFVNLLFRNQGAVLNFRGIALSANEQIIYSIDSRFGTIYYYNFLNYQPTFKSLTSPGVKSSLRNIVSLGDNVFYTRSNGIYAKNSYIGAETHIIGNNLSSFQISTDPLQITISGANTVAIDSVGKIYLSSSNFNSESILYKTTFVSPPRSNYQPPPARQQVPFLQPYPTTSCKRIVEPFSPRLRFGWGLTNTRNRPILDVVKSPLCCPPPIVNCPVTPFYCLPLPPPIFPPDPVAPVYPITVPIRQYIDHGHSTGFRSSISVPASVVVSTSLTFSVDPSPTQPAIGPLGEVYFLSGSGILTKLYSNNVSLYRSFGNATVAGPVVSTKGAVVVTTDTGTLYRLDSNANILSGYPIVLGQQIYGSPACITNGAFDYIVAAYGNTIGAFNAEGGGRAWTATTQTPGEVFKTSVVTDGINVFIGSDNKKIYCYTAQTGTLNWVYTVPSTIGGAPLTPYVTSWYIGVAMPDDEYLYILSNTTVRESAYDIPVRIPGGLQIKSTPVVSTDSIGNLWAHMIINSSSGIRRLLAVGGLEASVTNFQYKYIWSNASGEEIYPDYTLPVVDSSGFIYTSSTYGVINQYQAYPTASIGTTPSAQSFTSQFVMNGTSTKNNPIIQALATPLITGQNTMYVIAVDTTLATAGGRPINDDPPVITTPSPKTHYFYTISG